MDIPAQGRYRDMGMTPPAKLWVPTNDEREELRQLGFGVTHSRSSGKSAIWSWDDWHKPDFHSTRVILEGFRSFAEVKEAIVRYKLYGHVTEDETTFLQTGNLLFLTID